MASSKAHIIAQALYVMKRKTEVEKKGTEADKQRLKMRRKDSGTKGRRGRAVTRGKNKKNRDKKTDGF